jgi:adenine phosphoribosyltransferase
VLDSAPARHVFNPKQRNADDALETSRQHAAAILESKTVVIPDFPHEGIRYLDFYRTFDRNPEVRAVTVQCLVDRYRGYDIDSVAGVGAGGFSVASCLAFALGVPMHPIRKAGDTVHNAYKASVGMVYASRNLTLAEDIVTPQERVVLVDDTIATGGTALGGINLLEQAGAQVVEVATLYETTSRNGRAALGSAALYTILRRDSF